MKHFIITGTSRGIGEALAQQLMSGDHAVYCISRSTNQQLAQSAQERGFSAAFFSFDLNNIAGIESLFDDIFHEIRSDSALKGIYMINNAGMLSPVAPIQHNSAEAILENVSINLLAPMVTTSNFIKHAQGWATDKRIMNISSASAKYLLPSQSCYSTSKAGLDTFSKSIHLEQTGKDLPVRIASVYPGMIDTALQAQIRTTSKADFPYVEQFVQLAKEGRLQTPEATAKQLITLLASEKFGDSPLIEEL
jgi:benzil reductase ((S)-benzoin forming)